MQVLKCGKSSTASQKSKVKSQKSKQMQSKLVQDWQWLVYLRPAVPVNKYLIIGIVTTIVWKILSSQGVSQPPPCISPRFALVSQSLNTLPNSNTIVIGNVPENPYVVVVPGNSEQLLNVVRRYVKEAFLARNRRGAYVYAGGYVNRFQAECRSHVLRSQGLDARVVYFR